ncbi:IS6 family transposase (plasmid) [Azospirillum argentinense]|uniref:IS6 family transposase n=1 Tax=Azospirillum brasilense TaxID=192 RepID=A0A4D8QBN6_AZOBR|nr:IS6 family transposase [Azospirillum argentinense]
MPRSPSRTICALSCSDPYLRLTLSYRDVEELLAERGIDVSYETVRRRVLKFGPAIASNLWRLQPRPSPRWDLDEMVVKIGGRLLYLWRTVDDEGQVLEALVQLRRDKATACKLMRKLLRNMASLLPRSARVTMPQWSIREPARFHDQIDDRFGSRGCMDERRAGLSGGRLWVVAEARLCRRSNRRARRILAKLRLCSIDHICGEPPPPNRTCSKSFAASMRAAPSG